MGRCRHEWTRIPVDDSTGFASGALKDVCRLCGLDANSTARGRGRSSSRLGKDQERRAERTYGWEKIGERGEGTDLRGRFAEVQMKSTRRAVPATWQESFRKLDATKEDRVPLLLLSFVRQGVPTQDFILLKGSDWLALHGRDER